MAFYVVERDEDDNPINLVELDEGQVDILPSPDGGVEYHIRNEVGE